MCSHSRGCCTLLRRAQTRCADRQFLGLKIHPSGSKIPRKSPSVSTHRSFVLGYFSRLNGGVMSVLFNDDPFDISVSRKAWVLGVAAIATMVVPLLMWPRL